MGSAESIPVELKHRAFNLVNQAKYNTGLRRSEALLEIWLLTENDEYKVPLCDSSLQFLSLITDILHTSINDQVTLKNSIGCLCNLSNCKQNHMIICSPTLGLLPALISLIDESNGVLIQDHRTKKCIYSTISNCALNPETHSYLLANNELRYLDVLKIEMERDPGYLPPLRSFGCISLDLQNHYAYLLVHLRVHEIIVNRLISYGPIPANWPDRNAGMAYWSLNFITSFSSLPEGRKALRSLGKLNFFLQLLSCPEMEGVKSSVITSNILCGHEEDLLQAVAVATTMTTTSSAFPSSPDNNINHNPMPTTPTNNNNALPPLPPSSSPIPIHQHYQHRRTTSILQMFPQIYPTLMDVYSATLNFDTNRPEVKSLLSRGFGYTMLKMRDISATLRNLSMNNENKAIMLSHPSLIPFILKSIYLFIDNTAELSAIYQNYCEYAGGGGLDYDTISYLMELLLQLSFYYRDATSEGDDYEDQEDEVDVAKEEDSEGGNDDEHYNQGGRRGGSRKVIPISPGRKVTKINSFQGGGRGDRASDRLLLKEQFNRPEYHMIEMLQSFLSLPVDRKVPSNAKQYAQELLHRLLPL